MSGTAARYASDLLCVPTSCMTPLCGCSGGLSRRGVCRKLETLLDIVSELLRRCWLRWPFASLGVARLE